MSGIFFCSVPWVVVRIRERKVQASRCEVEMGIEPNNRFDSVNVMVGFDSGSVVKIFGFVRFGSVRNGLRMVFEFDVFGPIPISSLQLYHTSKNNNYLKHLF